MTTMAQQFRQDNLTRNAGDAASEAVESEKAELGIADLRIPRSGGPPLRLDADALQFEDGSILVLQGGKLRHSKASDENGDLPGDAIAMFRTSN